MKQGSEMDALVAEKVMGWRSMGAHWATGSTHKSRVHLKTSWCPSTDISAAWEVYKKTPGNFYLSNQDGKWKAIFRGQTESFYYKATGDTAPEAICRAALKACEDLETEKKGS